MKITKTKTVYGDLTQGRVEMDRGVTNVILEDLAHAMRCILAGADHKTHAGCFLVDAGDGIVVNAGTAGETVSYDDARGFVEEYT